MPSIAFIYSFKDNLALFLDNNFLVKRRTCLLVRYICIEHFTYNNTNARKANASIIIHYVRFVTHISANALESFIFKITQWNKKSTFTLKTMNTDATLSNML